MKKIKDASGWCLLLLAAAIFFTSCSSSKKFKSKTTEKTEEATTINTNTAAVKTTDTSSLKTNDSSYTNTSRLDINFDNDYPTGIDTRLDTEQKANDYDGAEPQPQPKPFVYNINGHQITTAKPIKSINLVNEQTGKVTAIEIKQGITKDSSGATAAITTQKTTQITTQVKQKQTTSYLWILIVIACIIGAALVYQIPIVKTYANLFFALFRRRKKQAPAA